MENFSFLDIFRQAWRLSFSYAALVFGSLMTCLLIALANISSTTSLVPDFNFPSLTVGLIFFLIFLFCKSGLILFYDHAIQKKRSKKINLTQIWQCYHRTLFLGVLFTSFVFLLIAILSLPLILVWMRTGEISSALLFLSLCTFLPLAFFVSLIQEFSFYYFLLTPLSVRGAIENSLQIFSRHIVLSIRFFVFILAISILFTFSTNLVMLGIVVLSQKLITLVSITSFPLVILQSVCIGWFSTLVQALWILFFHHLAVPKNPDLVQEENVLLKESVGETPAV